MMEKMEGGEEEYGSRRRRLSQRGPRPRPVSGVLHFLTICSILFGRLLKVEVCFLLLIAKGMPNMSTSKGMASGKRGKGKRSGTGNGTQFHNLRFGMRSIKLD